MFLLIDYIVFAYVTLIKYTYLLTNLTIYFEIWAPDLCQIMCFFLQITILLRMLCLCQRSRLISISEVDLHFTEERLFVTLLHIHHSIALRPSFNTDGKEVLWESYWETWWPGAASSRGRSRVGEDIEEGGGGPRPGPREVQAARKLWTRSGARGCPREIYSHWNWFHL